MSKPKKDKYGNKFIEIESFLESYKKIRKPAPPTTKKFKDKSKTKAKDLRRDKNHED